MQSREIRGLEIAANSNIVRDGQVWLVPSQHGAKNYRVDISGELPTCTCADYETNGLKCKHIFAAEFIARRKKREKPLTASQQSAKSTYKQAWPAYNAAQTNEKAKFLMLLYELCQGVEAPVQTCGRRRIPLPDVLFCAALKVYSGTAGRRLTTDMRQAHADGYVSRLPHYNSLFNYLETTDLIPYLREMITRSSLPLKTVENRFAVDSTGFSTGRFARWYSVRDEVVTEHNSHDWIKLHLICGVKTHIVPAVEITGRFGGDSPQFAPLVKETARNFAITEVTADKAYSGWENLRLVEKLNAVPYIPFRSNASARDKNAPSIWKQMFHLYSFCQDEFLEHYHRRSNVEATFSMIKAKFGDRLWCKTNAAQVNEALLKVLCHNICVVIQSMYELGIKPDFWAKDALRIDSCR
ncbi:MAG: transposase [Acidobacteriota bacterium]|nr:transposase [Acidobacteriota bacterium]